MLSTYLIYILNFTFQPHQFTSQIYKKLILNNVTFLDLTNTASIK